MTYVTKLGPRGEEQSRTFWIFRWEPLSRLLVTHTLNLSTYLSASPPNMLCGFFSCPYDVEEAPLLCNHCSNQWYCVSSTISLSAYPIQWCPYSR